MLVDGFLTYWAVRLTHTRKTPTSDRERIKLVVGNESASVRANSFQYRAIDELSEKIRDKYSEKPDDVLCAAKLWMTGNKETRDKAPTRAYIHIFRRELRCSRATIVDHTVSASVASG